MEEKTVLVVYVDIFLEITCEFCGSCLKIAEATFFSMVASLR